MTDQDRVGEWKTIVDSNRYMVLGTADSEGSPWVSPVWFATTNYRDFFWVSKPGARHSRNIAARGQVSVVIFDSRVRPGSARAVYMSALAGELPGDDLDLGLAVFNGRSEAQGLPPWTLSDVQAPARHRLFRATALEHFVLSDRDERLPVTLE